MDSTLVFHLMVELLLDAANDDDEVADEGVVEAFAEAKRKLPVGDSSSRFDLSLSRRAASSRMLTGKMPLMRLLCPVGSCKTDIHFLSQHAVQRSL